jgi:DnaK suppressor protein
MTDPKYKQKLRLMLRAKRKEVENELKILRQRAKVSVRSAGPVVTHNHPAEHQAIFNISLSLIPVKEKMIRKYKEAEARLERGEYGFCRICGESIPIARLQCVPFADRCRECKRAAEVADSVSVNGTVRRLSKFNAQAIIV